MMTRGAGAAVVLALSMVAAACGDDTGGGTTVVVPTDPSATAAPTTEAPVTTAAPTTTDAPAEPTLFEQAEARARAYVDAANDGAVEEFADITGAPLDEAQRRSWQFHAVLKSSGIRWHLGACEEILSGETTVKIECELENTNPVFVASGAGQAIWPFTLSDGVLTDSAWKTVGNPFTDALTNYVVYLQTFTDLYPVCDPSEQTGEFTEHGGIARVPECGEVIIAHQDDIVIWIEAGMPSG